MAWFYLLIAGIFEITWAIGLKYTQGFTQLWPSLVTIAGLIASFVFLAKAAVTLPIGTAYAVWTGIGAAGTLILGIILFHEPLHAARLFFLGLLLVGIIGLKITAS